MWLTLAFAGFSAWVQMAPDETALFRNKEIVIKEKNHYLPDKERTYRTYLLLMCDGI